MREEFDRVNRIRYDLGSSKPIKLEESEENCDGLVCLHNGNVVIKKDNRNSFLEEEGKSKSVDYIHNRKKDDDSLSFLTVKSEIITVSRKSSFENCENANICSLTNLEENKNSSEQTSSQVEMKQEDVLLESDPTPPNSPQETTLNTTYGTVLGEDNTNALKTKIQQVIDKTTNTITEDDEKDEEN